MKEKNSMIEEEQTENRTKYEGLDLFVYDIHLFFLSANKGETDLSF